MHSTSDFSINIVREVKEDICPNEVMACLANNTSTYVRMVRKKELLTKIDSGLYKSAIYGVKSIEGARS